MRNFRCIIFPIILLLITSCGGSGGNNHYTPPVPQSDWIIGPIVHGKNYSVGMPAAPTMEGAGWVINFPGSGGGIDAVINKSPPSLVGVKQLEMHYTVTGGGFYATEQVNIPGRVGICLQRRRDDWSGKGVYQQYRLYGQSRPLLAAGVNAVVAISAVSGSTATAVAGANTVTCTAVLSAVSGAVGASNTFTINVTVTKSAGASANHTCLVYAKLMNANSTGITIA